MVTLEIFENSLQFKIVLLGDQLVGKTLIRFKYLGKHFNSQYVATIGADFSTKTLMRQNQSIGFQIWDISGQTSFANLRTT